jgi:hypothetical protein
MVWQGVAGTGSPRVRSVGRCIEVREGGFGLEAVQVVAATGEHLAGDFGPNARKGEQCRSDLVDQLIKLMVGFGDFF